MNSFITMNQLLWIICCVVSLILTFISLRNARGIKSRAVSLRAKVIDRMPTHLAEKSLDLVPAHFPIVEYQYEGKVYTAILCDVYRNWWRRADRIGEEIDIVIDSLFPEEPYGSIKVVFENARLLTFISVFLLITAYIVNFTDVIKIKSLRTPVPSSLQSK